MKISRQIGLLFKTMLKHSLVVLFSFFFLWGQASTISNASDKASSFDNSNELIVLTHYISNPHYPSDLPCDIPTIPATDENEGFDDDDWDDTYYNIIEAHNAAIIITNNFNVDSNQSSTHKIETPLFVLYHCWKSFLI